MSSERTTLRLEELCDFINGFSFKSTDYVAPSTETVEVLRMGYISRGGGFKEDSTPVFVPRRYGKSLDKYLIQPRDIVIAMTDMKNNVAILGNTAKINDSNRFVLNQRVGCIRVKRHDLVDPDYLYYYSNWQPHVELLRSKANSGVQVNLSTSAIKEIEISLPSLDQQQQIGMILTAIDDRITLLRETNKTLESIAQAIFKSWFVDFDPVHAKAKGLAPEGMDEATAALFPDSFEETELGMVPKGWTIGTLNDLSNLNPESWTTKKHPEEIVYLDLANVKENQIANGVIFNFDDAPSRARRVLRDGDTIVGTVRPGNRSFAFIRTPPEGATGSTGFAVLRPKHKEDAEFLYISATQDSCIKYLEHLADGAAYPAVRPDTVSSLPCVIPKRFVLDAFHTLCEPLMSRMNINNRLSRVLAEIRDTLLPRLISGQLRIEEAQEMEESV